MTGFYEDCATADVCDGNEYHNYTGWAMGVDWTWATTPAAGDLTGVCFAEDKNCINILTALDADNTIQAWTNSDAPAAAVPTGTENTCNSHDDFGFSNECWYGTLKFDWEKHQFAYRFQLTDSATYREIGSVENVWVTGAYASTANLVTELMYEGAVSLTSAAGAIAASILF